jgi:PadR family transcriptional regulator AphA
MSLNYALLGIIDTGNRPYSGYELKKIFDSSMQFYWNATYTQIYSTLSRMYDEGLLTMEIVHQDDHPNRKMYAITDLGRTALREWVAKPFQIQKVRNAMLVQITLADRLNNAQVVAMLEAYCVKVQKRLATLKSDGVQGILKRARNERERFFWGVALEKGALTFERELEWVEGVLVEFKVRFVDI